MYDVKGEDINSEQGQRQGEQVEVTVVPLAHTVAHPWTVVIKTVCKKREKVINIKCTVAHQLSQKSDSFGNETSVKNTPVSAAAF